MFLIPKKDFVITDPSTMRKLRPEGQRVSGNGSYWYRMIQAGDVSEGNAEDERKATEALEKFQNERAADKEKAAKAAKAAEKATETPTETPTTEEATGLKKGSK